MTNLGKSTSTFILLLIANALCVSASDDITENVRQGANHRLKCQTSTSSSAPVDVNWKHGQANLPQSARHVIIPGGVLQILNFTNEDEGTYSCHASNMSALTGTLIYKLKVQPDLYISEDKPTEFLNPARSHEALTAKETATLECLTRYSSRIEWLRESGEELPARARQDVAGNLIIDNIQEWDSDVYVCNAINGRQVASQESYLTVNSVIVFAKKPQNMFTPTGHTVRFECEAIGKPSPSLKWLKNGRLVHSNGRIKLRSESSNANTLVVLQTVQIDSGMYECIAESEAFRTVASAQLYINASYYQPKPPVELRAVTLSSSTIKLNWKAAINLQQSNNITAYTVHYMPKIGGIELTLVSNTSSVVINNLKASTNYTFYVRAYNDRGISEQSEAVEQSTFRDAHTAPEVKSCTVSNESSSSFAVTCISDGTSDLEQSYLMEVYSVEARKLEKNMSSAEKPVFLADNLAAGGVYSVRVYAINARGKGVPVTLTARTLGSDLKQASQENINQVNSNPLLAILSGTVSLLIVMAIIIVIIMRIQADSVTRRRRRTVDGQSLDNCAIHPLKGITRPPSNHVAEPETRA
ncbi:Protogenin [Halotydeus destructor]|nr:Protogenin [Halotydeus destructor]